MRIEIGDNPVLLEEYRGELLDVVHHGIICVVDEKGDTVYSVGDTDREIFYRSASKPYQVIPVLMRSLHKKYNLTDEETVIFSGSHVGDEEHIAILQSIFLKCGLDEESLIVKPAVPSRPKANENRIRLGISPRKFYHNCSGKHAALMLLQRELTGSEKGYELPNSPAEQEVLRVIAELAETRCDDIKIGIDGCGVPVFALKLKNMAISAKNLVAFERVKDKQISEAVADYIPKINRYKNMMRGEGYLCSELNTDNNIIAKGGANGVYAFGLKREKLGIAFKLLDGTETGWPIVIKQILNRIGYENRDTNKLLDQINNGEIKNDNEDIVGHCKAVF